MHFALSDEISKGTERILLSVGTFLLGCTFFAILTSTTLFLFRISISPINILISPILSAMMCYFFLGHSTKYTLISALVGICVLILAVLICTHFYDWSYDGNTYHKSMVGALKYGWNPLYETFYDFAHDHLDFLSTRTNTWYDAYPKGTEIWGACVYALTNHIEGGKSFNIISVISAFCIGAAFLAETQKLRKWQIWICTFFCVINPVMMSQIITFYNDGFLWQMVLVCGIALLYLTIYEGGKYESLSLYLIFISTNIGFNTKFSAIIFFAVECIFFFGVWVFIRVRRGGFKKHICFLRKRFLFFVGMVLSGTLLVGASSYVINTIRHRNPVYTMIGEGAANIIPRQLPDIYHDMTHFMRFIASLFSRTNGSRSLSHVEWKIPFIFDANEFQSAEYYDVRTAGWGILFSGIFLLSLLIIMFGFYRMRRSKLYLVRSLAIGGLLGLFFLVTVVPGLSWARFNCAIFFIPPAALIYLFIQGNQEPETSLTGVFISGILTALLTINIMPNIVRIGYEWKQSEITNDQLEQFSDFTDYNEIIIGCEDSERYEGRFFNLYDKQITDFTFGAVRDSERTGKLFPTRHLNYLVTSGPASITASEVYLDYIHEKENLIILIAVKDEGSQGLNDAIVQKMRELGTDFDLPSHYRYSYLAVIDDKKILYEGLADEVLTYNVRINQFEIEMLSAGYSKGNASSIIVNGIERSLNRRGLNIVVLDKSTGKFIDSVTIDSYLDNSLSR